MTAFRRVEAGFRRKIQIEPILWMRDHLVWLLRVAFHFLEMWRRRLLTIPADRPSESDDDILILHPSDDELCADFHEETKIPLDPKGEVTLKDPRTRSKLRRKKLSVLTWYVKKKSYRENTVTSFYRPVRSIEGDAQILKSLLKELRVESPGINNRFTKVCEQTFALIKRGNQAKSTQVAYVLKALTDTALACLRIITYKLSSCDILDPTHVIAQHAFTLLKTLAHRRNGCGRAELQSAARNVAWFLAVQVERTPPSYAEDVVLQLITWKRLMNPFPRAWEIVQWALQQRLLEQMLILGDYDDIEPVFLPWHLIMEQQPLADAATLWLSKFSVLQLRTKPTLLSRNLESLRIALGFSTTLEVSQLRLTSNRW